ncbi:hypothetical protein ACWEJ7_24475 [Streptomyces albidoflavus]
MSDEGVAVGTRRWAWPLTVVANLCLGVIGVVPLFLLMLFLKNYPLAALGLTSREPTDNDGMLPWAMILIPMFVVYGGLWHAVNAGLRSLTGPAHARRHWGLAILLTSAPTLSLPVGALISGSF